ncbi:MAG: prephenate dehydratase [Nitrospinota bacterium]
MNDRLKYFRSKIDAIDEKVVKLLTDRAKCALKIVKLKQSKSAPIYHPSRENDILSKISKLNQGPLSSDSLKNIYKEIFSATRAVEQNLIVSSLGPAGAFSHIAAMNLFGQSVTHKLQHSFNDIFSEVQNGNANYGVVPIENSIEGSVGETFRLLERSNLFIYAEYDLPITLHLLSRAKDLSAVKKVYSHSMPLAQSRNWLQKELPNVKIEESSSTTAAAQIASKDSTAAAIASASAASIYNLGLLAKNIENNPDNRTRFFVIANHPSPKCKDSKSSIVVKVSDKPKALYNLLAPFSKEQINLSKIESRPALTNRWEYFFFIDFEGHLSEKKVKSALTSINKHANSLKFLGSYPKVTKL